MQTIRLQRVGRKNDPSFRVILVEKKRAAKTGVVSEILGNYNARTGATSLQGERIKALIKNGVTVSDNMHNILINNKVIEGKKINILPKKTVEKAEAAEEVAAPAAAPETADAGTTDVSPAAEVKEEEAPAAEGDNQAGA